MKGLVVLFLLAVVAIIGYFKFMSSMDSDSQVVITLAFGNSDKTTSELNVVVQPLTVHADPPRTEMDTGFVHWDEWVEDHYILNEDGGNRVKFERIAHSNFINERDAGGAPECYLRAKVKHNASYTFEFVPVKGGPNRYRKTFTGPAGDQKMSRDIFARVKD